MFAASCRPPGGRLPLIPAPRRLPVTLAVVASIGVLATSLRALPAVALVPLAAAWLAAFAVAAFARNGALVLTVLAGLVKAVTAALIIWVFAAPHSPVGPRSALDWVPLGLLNSSTGLWLYAVIRHRAR